MTLFRQQQLSVWFAAVVEVSKWCSRFEREAAAKINAIVAKVTGVVEDSSLDEPHQRPFANCTLREDATSTSGLTHSHHRLHRSHAKFAFNNRQEAALFCLRDNGSQPLASARPTQRRDENIAREQHVNTTRVEL